LNTEVPLLIKEKKRQIKLGSKGTPGALYEIYYKLKAIEEVLKAKGVRTTPSNVKKAAASLGNQLNLNIKYKF
jgi:predicted transcriptional regulator with HTH domain